MDKATVLRQLAFHTHAPAALQRRIQDASTFVHLEPGADFYREGDLGEGFALVGRGDIRVFKTAENGREIALYHVMDGEPCLVNMLCVFLGRAAMASARVEAPTDAVVLPAEKFREWVNAEPYVRDFVFETMAKRLVDVMTLVEEVAFRRMDTRLAELLLRKFPDKRVPLHTTHEELAAELGTVREVVSRLLKEFERAGTISIARGQLELRDDASLRRLAVEAER